MNVWHEHNPGRRDFTFYSDTHKGHSLIDHILVAIGTLPHSLDSKIIPIAWSEQNMITFKLLLGWITRSNIQWSLNESLLSDHSHALMIKAFIKDFHDLNDLSDVSRFL